MEQMIVCIVTTCLTHDHDTVHNLRNKQYLNGIRALQASLAEYSIDAKIVIVENNGPRTTFLDSLGPQVFYTHNNQLQNVNKGVKEIQDVFHVINSLNLQDNDFVIKMTGRYVLHAKSFFMRLVKDSIQGQKGLYDAILRYGPYFKPVDTPMEDCITGLIGLRVRVFRSIKVSPNIHDCIEWAYARATLKLESGRVCLASPLGISICPMSDTYFDV